MSFLLKITAGKSAGSEFTLHDGKNMVGRSRSSDVRVFNEDVSGKHFVIEIANGVAILQNISGYGTRVDGVLIHQEFELHSGQVIEAGKTLKFLFEATEAEEKTLLENNDADVTGVTKFIGDVENADNIRDSVELTSVTSFNDTVEQTSVTKFAADLQNEVESDTLNETSVTKFAVDLQNEVESDTLNETSVTKFAVDLQNEVESDTLNETSVTKFAGSSPESANKADGLPKGTETALFTFDDATEIGTSGAFIGKTGGQGSFDDTVSETVDMSNATRIAYTGNGSETESDRTAFSTSVSGSSRYGEEEKSDNFGEEQGMFFEEEELQESEKTNANETQVVQTRMASMEEINFIKNQIKKQQQNRLLLKFLIFILFVVLLGVIWMLKAPQQEKIVSWPFKKINGEMTPQTGYAAAFEKGLNKGGFDIYYPLWGSTRVINKDANTIEVHTFLGKKADVPLTVTLYREVSDEFVYENRTNALQNMLRRLSERKNEQFNFDGAPASEFLTPAYGQSENGIMVDKLAYQRDTGSSWFGVLRFFRSGRVNYIVRAEVPAEEKLRAFPILNSDTFVEINPEFIRSHWEGSDEYIKGRISRVIVGVKDELQRNSPMQYPRLEREIKSILAQALYEKNESVYKEANSLLLLLRARQQLWYNGQKVRWISAVRENNYAEKMKIRNDCEAVFSVIGDKRRYDILRDHWE